MSKESRPFLPLVHNATRPLGAVLPALANAPVTSPWLPRPPAEPVAAPAAAPAGPSPAELAAAYDAARDEGFAAGRTEGLSETAALRTRLAAALDQIDAARATIVPPTAETIAEIATCVVEAWIGNLYPALTFRPIVQHWLAHAADAPTTVRVHPDDASALTEAIGGAALTIAPDPAVARGAIELSSGTRELVHDFAARLGDLRTAIVTALTGVDE